MPAMELLSKLIGMRPKQLSKDENTLLEAELFTRLCEKLKENFKSDYGNYFHLLNLGKEKENEMLESYLTRCVINDILATKEYTLAGIAYYTQMPEEIIQEFAIGNNTYPSILFFRKIIEIHRSVRKDLYQLLTSKIIEEYLNNQN